MTSKARLRSSRINKILDLCMDQSSPEKENQPPLQQPESTPPSTIKHTNEKLSSKTGPGNDSQSEVNLVNSLYSAEYSLTTSIFDNFGETKTSLDIGLESSKLIKTCSAALPFNRKDLAPAVQIPNRHLPDPDSCNNTKMTDQEASILQPNQSLLDLVCHENIERLSTCSLSSFEALLDYHDFSKDKHQANSPQASLHSLAGDFSSDDSVKDRNYSPSEESEDNDSEPSFKRPKQCSSNIKSSNTHICQANITGQSEVSSNNQQPEVCLNTAQSDYHTVQPELGFNTTQPGDAPSISQPEICASSSAIATTENQTHNNKGKTSVKDRKLQQKQQKRLSYEVKIGCTEKCAKKCSTKFTAVARTKINKYYWDLSWQERRVFIQNSTAVAIPKRKMTAEPKRAPRSTFSFKNLDGTSIEVCKIFFLTTLGFNKNNDTVLYNSLTENKEDRRGLHTKTAQFDRKLLTDHVNSFHPLEPHYRREHAPLRRYLPCDVTITLMHKDFCEKNPSQKVCYELYRKHVKSMNISFAKLGNEECEVCEAYDLHSKSTSHNVKNAVPEDCDICISFEKHRNKYSDARALYNVHKCNAQSNENIYCSVDLQKVTMLPRLDCFKKILFCPRLTTFHLTFAPVGKISHQQKPLACIWHDGTSGRKQEDIISCYYYFILQHRDVKHIHIWMDNCSAQNKNWLLFSFMLYLVNSDLIATQTINFYYFEPGHTFMSCDQFHHQVELAMKKQGKLYDFKDFSDCVASANLSKVDVKIMEHIDFFNFPNLVSDRRIQTSSPRVYMKDILQIKFERNNLDLLYKNDLGEEFKTLRFMKDKYLKNKDVLSLEFKNFPKGIEQHRKDSIIKALDDMTPPHKMQFWHEMPVCTTERL